MVQKKTTGWKQFSVSWTEPSDTRRARENKPCHHKGKQKPFQAELNTARRTTGARSVPAHPWGLQVVCHFLPPTSAPRWAGAFEAGSAAVPVRFQRRRSKHLRQSHRKSDDATASNYQPPWGVTPGPPAKQRGDFYGYEARAEAPGSTSVVEPKRKKKKRPTIMSVRSESFPLPQPETN